jgi:hypothetical protein
MLSWRAFAAASLNASYTQEPRRPIDFEWPGCLDWTSPRTFYFVNCQVPELICPAY